MKFNPPVFIEIAGGKRWTKTHAHFSNVGGASFCRRVVISRGDWRRKIKKGESPTCKDCLVDFPALKAHLAKTNRYRATHPIPGTF